VSAEQRLRSVNLNLSEVVDLLAEPEASINLKIDINLSSTTAFKLNKSYQTKTYLSRKEFKQEVSTKTRLIFMSTSLFVSFTAKVIASIFVSLCLCSPVMNLTVFPLSVIFLFLDFTTTAV